MNASEINIRPATPDDALALLQLYAQPDYDNAQVLSEEGARTILFNAEKYPFYKFYIGEREGRPLGTYALLVMENIGHMGTPSAIVESVAVAPDAQGMGVGRALMAHALAIAVAQGCYKLALSSNIKRTAAHAFYDRLGFQRHGVSFVVPLAGKGGA
jgi:GNAT superfamily N-acetyltransferase